MDLGKTCVGMSRLGSELETDGYVRAAMPADRCAARPSPICHDADGFWSGPKLTRRECAWGLSDGAGNVRIGNPATRPGSDEVGGSVGAPGGGALPVADVSVREGILVEFDAEAGCVGQVRRSGASVRCR